MTYTNLSVSSTGLKPSILIQISILVKAGTSVVAEESFFCIPQLPNQLSVVDSVADSGSKTLSNVIKAGGLSVAILILHVLTCTCPVLSLIGQIFIPFLKFWIESMYVTLINIIVLTILSMLAAIGSTWPR